MPFSRDDLVQRHIGLVHYLARRLHNTLSDEADLDELVSAGLGGLLAAADGFEAERGLAQALDLDLRGLITWERERLREALHLLDRDALEVLVLSFFENRPWREIAPRLGVTESGVSRIRTRALRQLRQHLTQQKRVA